MNEPAHERTAHLDETGVRINAEQRLYGIAAVITSRREHAEICDALRPMLLPGRTCLHHYDETIDRRLSIAKVITRLTLEGALVVVETTAPRQQERARTRLLTELLPRLQHQECVDHVVLESRAGSDKHDRRTLDRLRRSRVVTASLRVDHVRKDATPLVWLPDFIAGSYFAAEHHGEPEPWALIAESHLIDVRTIRDGE
ncbi:hypothetical protein ACFFSW_32465 [Saccharothrix longispora]|uniref:DUF3800 domain-containing protein n=1 Tax=Saccharothrix longispora TaxID=33920 RepID=A0ABU1Q1U7_9PSEU|nr:hypothetical protein [Saccharothrix longispora]MDR6596865.1 hypothetical protein [Saccharothrix longispora]